METTEYVDKYQNLRFQRTRKAEEFLGIVLRTIDKEANVGDNDVSDYLGRKNLNLQVPRGKNEQTPDIMFAEEEIRMGKKQMKLYVGDVTVTRSVHSAATSKSEKYDDLRRRIELSNPGLLVFEFNFVLGEDLSNLDDIMKDVRRDFGVVWSNRDIKSFVEEIERLNEMMKNVCREVPDIKAFGILLSEADKNETHDADYVYGPFEEEEEYRPVNTEGELFRMIWDESISEDYKGERPGEFGKYSKIVIEELRKTNDAMEDRPNTSILPILTNPDAKENEVGVNLIEEYMVDLAMNAKDSAILSLLPCSKQLNKMRTIEKEFKKSSKKADRVGRDRVKFLEKMKKEFGQTTPYYSSSKDLSVSNGHDHYKQFVRESKKKNEVKKPASIRSDRWDAENENCKKLGLLFSGESPNFSTNLEFDCAETSTAREEANIGIVKPIYERINKSRAAVLVSSFRKLVNDMSRISKTIGRNGIYYSTPIQSTFIAGILTTNNIGTSNPFFNFFTVARFDKEKDQKILEELMESDYKKNTIKVEETRNYVYILSKLHKLSLEQLSKLSNCDAEFRAHSMAMSLMVSAGMVDEKTKMMETITTSSVFDMEKVFDYLDDYLGISALCILDLHQTPSSILDLMKYLVSMVMSSNANLKLLLTDKLALMYKTSLDVRLLYMILDFVDDNIALSHGITNNEVRFNSKSVENSSLGIKGQFRSLYSERLIFDNPKAYLAESQLMFQLRPKKTYGSQFIAKAAHKVASNNKTMREENHEGLTSRGHHVGKYNFKSTFGYSRDAMYYAQMHMNRDIIPHQHRHKNKIAKINRRLAIHNTSYRGACKEEEWMKPGEGKSMTAMNAGLELLKNEIKANNTDECRVGNVVRKYIDKKMAFNMSEKEQRGAGRPIGSASPTAKQKLYLFEECYECLSNELESNLMKKTVNKTAKISNMNTKMISTAANESKKHVYHIVMDQTQFSESDNMNKFKDNVEDNPNIPKSMKPVLKKIALQMMERTQYFPIINDKIRTEHPREVTKNGEGVKGTAGWVQGMLNRSSTYIHIMAVNWITKMFNDHYPRMRKEQGKEITGLVGECINVDHAVNSDDSYAIVSAHDKQTVTDYYNFLITGKRMFCLKQNVKKSYLTRFMGEIIQKYVANGTVIVVWGKIAINVFNGMQGYDLTKDVLSSVGLFQTIIREGAPETYITYLRAELKVHIMRLYNLGKGKCNDLEAVGIDWFKLPCEMGGWPGNISSFELANAGSNAQLDYIKRNMKSYGATKEVYIMAAAIRLNENRKSVTLKRKNGERMEPYQMDICDELEAIDNSEYNSEFNDIELELITKPPIEVSPESTVMKNIVNPFSFIYPITRKVCNTIGMIRELKGEPSGLAGLHQIDNDVRVALADIYEMSNEMITKLSESGFQKDVRRKAAANSAAASQKVVTIGGYKKRLTIQMAYLALHIVGKNKMFSSLSKAEVCDIVYRSIIPDISGKSRVVRHISQNFKIKASSKCGPMIVNKVPNKEAAIDMRNDMKSVLSEIVKPGFLKAIGHKFKSESTLEIEKEKIKNRYRNWLDAAENSVERLEICRAIYYHHLTSRVSRWFNSPYLNNTNILTFYTGVYCNTQDGIVSHTGKLKDSEELRSILEVRETVLQTQTNAAVELFWWLTREVVVDDPADNISLDVHGKRMTLKEYVSDIKYEAAFEEATFEERKSMAALRLKISGDAELCRKTVKGMEPSIRWEVEQKKLKSLSGTSYYTGYFSVLVSRGQDAIRVKGEPGEITSITSNTLDVTVVTNLLYHLIAKEPFPGFLKPKRKEEWGSTGFYRSSELPTRYVLVYRKCSSSTIEENRFCDLLKANTSGNILPFSYDPTMKSYHVETTDAGSITLIEEEKEVIGEFIVIKKTRGYSMKTGMLTEEQTDSLARRRLFKYRTTLGSTDYGSIQVKKDNYINGISLRSIIEKGIAAQVIRKQFGGIKTDLLKQVIADSCCNNDVVKWFFMRLYSWSTGKEVYIPIANSNIPIKRIEVTKFAVEDDYEDEEDYFEPELIGGDLSTNIFEMVVDRTTIKYIRAVMKAIKKSGIESMMVTFDDNLGTDEDDRFEAVMESVAETIIEKTDREQIEYMRNVILFSGLMIEKRWDNEKIEKILSKEKNRIEYKEPEMLCNIIVSDWVKKTKGYWTNEIEEGEVEDLGF